MLRDIPRCYDSHVHLLATGALQTGLRLFDLKSADDVGSLKIDAAHFRGEWLVGFGWDQTKWKNQELPSKDVLDRFFPHYPVVFTRADGHTAWLNSKALERAGFLNQTESSKPTPASGVIHRDEKGLPTGIFGEAAKIQVDMLIPPPTRSQNRDAYKAAIHLFNSRGFSHVRDMTGSLSQWQALHELDTQGELTLYVEQNFVCENLNDFDRALAVALWARQEESEHLRARGIKFFFDGSLGSEGALLSQFYNGTRKTGLQLWNLEEIETGIQRTWENGFEVCVHTIGDQAAHLVLQVAKKIQTKKGIKGILNLEHCQLIRPETIEFMKSLSVICHMQPCHWLSDRRWLREKLGSLYSHVFPWSELEKNHLQIQWGSDSPIEEPSVAHTLRALEESAHEGIAPLAGSPLKYYSHHDVSWGHKCLSLFEDARLKHFTFDGRDLTESLALE